MDAEKVTIDGDRVVAFIKAIENLAEILNHLNVIEVKEAFLVGKQIGCVERVIETEKKWKEVLAAIRAGFKEDMDSIREHQKQAASTIETLKLISSYARSSHFEEVIANLSKLNDICDKLDAHRKSGLLQSLHEFGTSKTL